MTAMLSPRFALATIPPAQEPPAVAVAHHLDQHGAYTSRIGNHRFLTAYGILQAMTTDWLRFPFPLTITLIEAAQIAARERAS